MSKRDCDVCGQESSAWAYGTAEVSALKSLLAETKRPGPYIEMRLENATKAQEKTLVVTVCSYCHERHDALSAEEGT